MINRFLNGESKTVTGAAILIASATLLSRLVGVMRDRVFAHYFSAGSVMDAYYAAFKIPDLIYNLLIVGALTAGFIPTFTKLFYENGKDKSAAWKLVNNVVNIAAVLLLIICALGIVFAPYLTKIIAPGFPAAEQALAATFTRIMFISPFLFAISMIMGGILQSLRQFTLYAIAPIFYNLGIIIGATLLTKSLGIAGLAWGVVIGALLHCVAQLYGAYANGYRWQWRFKLHDPETKLIGKLMIPRTLGLGITQLNAVIITILASLLPVGSVTIYNFASNLQAVPTGIIGIPFALAVFPLLSRFAIEKNKTGFSENLSATTRQILFLIVPASIIILLLRAQIVRVIYGTGAFDWTATITMANTLVFFALGLFAQSLIPLFARAFYAQSNTKTPFVFGIIAELISIIAALMLMRVQWLGVAGLALASSIGAIINAGLLGFGLYQLVEDIQLDRLLRSLFKISVAGLLMAVTVQYLKYPLSEIVDMTRFWGILLHGLVSGTIGLLVYGVVCRLLQLEEMLHFQGSLKKRWLRLWNVPAGIDEAEGL